MEKITVDREHNIYCSLTAIAKQLGITKQRVSAIVKENEIPKSGQLYNLTFMLHLRREQEAQREQDLSDTAKKLKAEADYKTSKARQEELVLMQMMGELIPGEQVKDSLETLFLDVRQTVLTIPENIKTRVYSIAPDLANECAEVANETVKKILTILASGNDTSSTAPVGEKPKRHYTKRKAGVSAATSTDGE